MGRVTLIGMPGSGKSSVGRLIACRLGWNFIDTDKSIEERHGGPLPALIARVGDREFRRLEEGTLLELVIPERSVISTGGSAVYSEAAMTRLASLSTVVFLDAPFEALRAHIGSEPPRGIIGMTKGGLEKLFRDRLPRYRRHANFVVPCDEASPDEIADMVIALLPPG